MDETQSKSGSPPESEGKSASGAALSQTAAEAKAEVKELAQQASSQASAMVEQRKGAVAESLSSFARALENTADQLENDRQSQLAGYTASVASSLRRASTSLHDRDLAGLRHDAERFARERPALFLGGCVALGFALSRFFKAGAEESSGIGGEGERQFGAEDEPYREAYGESFGERSGEAYGEQYGEPVGVAGAGQPSGQRPPPVEPQGPMTEARPGASGTGSEPAEEPMFRPVPTKEWQP
jgi:gas vesicle protein